MSSTLTVIRYHRTGAHFDLKTGKLTIDGTVPGSEVKKCFPDSTESNTTSEFLVSASATTGNFELRLLGGTYSITSTHVSRTYAGIVPLSVNTAENGKVRLSGCTVRVTNCSGLAVYGIRSSCDMVVDRCRFELIIDKANEKYSASALLASNANSSAVIRNTTATVTGTDTEHKTKIYTLDLRSADCVVEKCTISATTPVTNICSGIDLFGTAKVVMNDCVVVSGSTTEAASGDYRALRTANGAEAQINGGYYRGDSGAFGLLSTIYIDGNQADETTHPEYEYCFAAEVETDAATLYVKDENGFWIAVC